MIEGELLVKHIYEYKECSELRRVDELIENYYEKGDFVTCFKGCLELAEKGYSLAECQVGYFYLTGQGVEKDLDKALYWSRLAAGQGDPDAIGNVQDIERIKAIKIREVKEDEFNQLLELYTQLGDNHIPAKSEQLDRIKHQIINDENYHVVVAVEDGKIVSSCVCVIIPNLTHEQRPYAFVENVVTDMNYRKMGLASLCLDYAKSVAVRNNCYKMMLMTGSKKESTLNFYEHSGYNRKDKTAFVQWL